MLGTSAVDSVVAQGRPGGEGVSGFCEAGPTSPMYDAVLSCRGVQLARSAMEMQEFQLASKD